MAGSELGEFPMFSDLSDTTFAPVLTAFYGGRWGRNNNPVLSDEELIDRTTMVLRKILGTAILDLIDAVATHRTTDQWSLGSYSYPVVGSSSLDSEMFGSAGQGSSTDCRRGDGLSVYIDCSRGDAVGNSRGPSPGNRGDQYSRFGELP